MTIYRRVTAGQTSCWHHERLPRALTAFFAGSVRGVRPCIAPFCCLWRELAASRNAMSDPRAPVVVALGEVYTGPLRLGQRVDRSRFVRRATLVLPAARCLAPQVERPGAGRG